jgi:Zn finger protein HypA/HybF involved in hydrogenase expression
MNREDFLFKAKGVHGDRYSYSKVGDVKILSRKKIEIICPAHGLFEQRVCNHLIGVGCPKCGNSFFKTSDDIKNQIRLVHGDRYDLSEVNYINSKTPIMLKCPTHGTFSVMPPNIINRKSVGCLKCHGKDVFDASDFIEKARRIHGSKFDYSLSLYVDAKTRLKILCNKHGEFLQTPETHLASTVACPKCSSRASAIEKAWLSSLGIPNLKFNHKIKVGQRRFFVDGFDENTNTIYEFNGDYFHGNPLFFDPLDINTLNKTSFGILYGRTIEKERVLKEAGYNVVSIWEHEFRKNIGQKSLVKPLDRNLIKNKRVLLMRYLESIDSLRDYSFLLET